MERIVTQVQFAPAVPKRKRVAAYARVSSGKDAMLCSLSAQVSYYAKLIQSNTAWEYVGVYADEALSGTKDERENFQRLIADCKAGKVDMVITKSISRFARNTVTLLETVRELKSIGVDVYFEEQNIHTVSSEGELMLTILASYAQEESLSASENQKWRVKRNFENGKPWSARMLGYRYENGKFVVIPDEAEVVKRIYQDYLSGMGAESIMKALTAEGITSRFGKPFCKNSIINILRNYAYTGNLLLHITYRDNHLTKRKTKNLGELPKYHVENCHEAIIDIGTYNSVQTEMKKRSEKFTVSEPKKTYPFTGLITCTVCGKHYRRKTARGKPIWICPTYNTYGKDACASKAIPEDTLLALADEVGGIGEITEIRAEEDNTLTFIIKSGERTVKRLQTRKKGENKCPK